MTLATHYNNFQISSTYEISQSLRQVIYIAWQFRYEELYEDAQLDSISLEETLETVLKALNEDGLGYKRYIFMALILVKAIELTILAYRPNDPRPQAVLQWIEEKLDHQTFVDDSIHSLFTDKSIGYQAFDEALDILRNSLDIFNREKAKVALLEMLDDCLEGYAIFPGSQGRRDLFNWWLLEVVPASWCLKSPNFLYTIKGVIYLKNILDYFFKKQEN